MFILIPLVFQVVVFAIVLMCFNSRPRKPQWLPDPFKDADWRWWSGRGWTQFTYTAPPVPTARELR
jgi:hypothetical protein